MPTPLSLGSITIERIVEQDRLAFMPFTQFFPTVTPELIAENRHWLAPDYLDPASAKVLLTIQSYVVRAGGLVILIDSCVGNHKARPARPVWHMMASDAWLTNLAALGLSVDDIDIVLCSHLHGDHVGWNTRLDNGRWVPTFPKARYLLADRELDFWTAKHKSDPASCPWIEDSVLPIVAAKRAEIITSTHSITETVRVIPTPGHTIDHFSVEVGERSGQQALITGDMVHSPLQIKYPEIGMISDYDSAAAGRTRRAVFTRCCDDDILLCTAHFPGNPIGRVQQQGSAFRFVCD